MDKSVESKDQDHNPKRSPFDELSREDLITKCKGLLVIAQKAKQSKSELQNEVEQYKTQLLSCEKEIKSREDSIKTLQELVDSLTEQKLTFITEIDTAQTKIRALNNKCNVYEDELNKLKTEINVKDQNLTSTSQQLSDFDSKIISLERQNTRLLEENEQLINQLTELEARTEEFNKIGLQQQEQLKMLEERVRNDEICQNKIIESNYSKKNVIREETSEGNETNIKEYELKIEELKTLYEQEKSKKEKCNIKLRSYKDKILKCATCIHQLKNSRFILAKTVKEYSESIPKWQNEIIKASNALDAQIKVLHDENISLKEKLNEKENTVASICHQKNSLNDEILKLNGQINELKSELTELQTSLTESKILNNNLVEENNDLKLKEVQFNNQLEENRLCKEKINNLSSQLCELTAKCTELEKINKELKGDRSRQQDNHEHKEVLEQFKLQIRALESEKATLVKEKLNVKDNLAELENANKNLSDTVDLMNSQLTELRSQLENVTSEYERNKREFSINKEQLEKQIMTEKSSIKEQYEKLKREYDNLQDLNGLLQEEVETLKLSLEQPKDDADNSSDLNVSLQADIVKLETKLSAYKQENSSLLSEVKESRNKIKEYDRIVAECEEMKTKLVGYKSENAELLNEMKEINQVLKERGEAISKLQKAVTEMEKLIETLEKDRDSVKEENEDLHKKIDLLENDLKSAQCIQSDSTGHENEKENLRTTVEERDAMIASLKEEIEKLKLQSSSVDLPNEDMSTSTISRAEEHTRMRDLDESFEDRYTKLRMFALKLKMKLNETTSQLQSSEQEKANLKKMLADNNMNQQSQDTVDEKENGVAELESQVKKLSRDLENSEKVNKKITALEAELAAKSQQLDCEIEHHKATKEQLEKALKDVKKKKVLSLEMEDYERSLKELTTKMEEKKKKIVQMESTIDNQEGTITSMQTQIKLLQEQIKTEENQCRLLKEELQQAVADSKDKDQLLSTNKDIITKLMQDIEDEKRKNEEADMEMTSALSEKEKVIIHLSEEKIELGSKMKKLEFKFCDIEERLRITNIELADLKTEYASYKVRAQAVLRQNQTVDHSQEEQFKEEAAALRAQIETLNQKMAALQEQLSVASAEAEAGRKRAADSTAELSRSQQRNARLHTDLTRLSQQLDTERAQHKLQISTLTQCYKTQISDLESKHQKETDNLKKQLSLLQENVKSGNSNEPSQSDKYLLPVISKEEGSDNEMDINVSLIPREEGEGSESAPSPPLSKSMLSSGRRSPVPLDRLLEEGVPDNDSLDTSSLALTIEQEVVDLRRKVQAQQERVKHVTVLLSESERERARLSQLSELLKGELRRARPPASAAHNTQYMKNVTLKFLTLPPGDERCRLVPVLQKILTLSTDETQKIQAVAKGQDPNPGKGWGSYLPWPGGK
ncbi:GRIP and coiled-coil domain-containing protein 2 [Danaus plexippus]|uniref:GRIP and coiled-coil domain-containing protein 2 n=1 Tax=Danaus plexippus TaxID=13037 RepID=UPI002AB1E03C|nr:GRIP and coiled-coil domain-containing protein 2 [Danaus plexippus]